MPKVVDPDERRAQLVSASWNVIAAEGLKAATLRRVAAEAGCTTGALTHYFSDRRSLLIHALRGVHFQAAARMLEASRQSSSARARLEAVLREALPLDDVRLREWRVWLAFWAESMNDAELALENARRYAEWRKLIEQVVRPLCDSKKEAEREAGLLLAVIDGLGLRLARQSKNAALQRECKRSLAHFLRRFD